MKYEFFLFDLWPYILIACIFLFCHLCKPKNSNKIFFFTLLIFSIFRYDVGWDYTSYVSVIESGYDNIVDSRYEFFSKYIFLIGSYLSFYPIVFAIFSFLTLRIFYITVIRYSINPLLSWLVFYSMPLFFFASLTTIRQSLAMLIVFFSYRLALEKKYIYFLITIIISMLIHPSAIVGILILPIVIFPVGKLINIILFICSFYVGSMIISFINNSDLFLLSRLKMYIGFEEAKPQLLNYLYYAFGIFNLLFYDKLVKINPKNKAIITLINAGVILLNLFSFEPITSLRISAFFLLFLVYLIPYYTQIFNKQSSRIIENILVSGFISLSFFYLYIFINGYNNGVLEKVSFLPYQFWFNNL
jgi:hypothetical protein